jgi:single-stranded-DNA-specific exonuclease
VGFSLPSSKIADLRLHLDQYAHQKLTAADLEPALAYDAALALGNITPEFYQTLKLLEPFGVGNHEPVFAAEGVSLIAPPKIVKDKHVRLKVSGRNLEDSLLRDREPSTPRCDPDSSSIHHREPERSSGSWRKAISFPVLGWRMAERLQSQPLIAGDSMDIAYTIGQNDHPEFGGIELTLRDFRTRSAAAPASAPQQR